MLKIDRGGLEVSRWWDYVIPARRDEDPEWLAEEMGLDPADVKRLDLQSRAPRSRPRVELTAVLAFGGVGVVINAT